MSWDVQTRQTHGHGSHVKVRWRELGTIYDVSIDCPRGVHGAGTTGLVRQEMNGFSKAIDAYFEWDEDVEGPYVTLAWADEGEQCLERLRLDPPRGHRGASSSAAHPAAYLRDGMLRVLGKARHGDATSHARKGKRADA